MIKLVEYEFFKLEHTQNKNHTIILTQKSPVHYDGMFEKACLCNNNRVIYNYRNS